ncbi:hypothetical protein XELAEV_18030226mg, partial [Xenopus laevis]
VRTSGAEIIGICHAAVAGIVNRDEEATIIHDNEYNMGGIPAQGADTALCVSAGRQRNCKSHVRPNAPAAADQA